MHFVGTKALRLDATNDTTPRKHLFTEVSPTAKNLQHRFSKHSKGVLPKTSKKMQKKSRKEIPVPNALINAVQLAMESWMILIFKTTKS